MSDWQTKRLGDILQLNYGKSLSVKNRVEGGIPVYGSNGIVGSHNEAIVDVPGLIVGRKGSAGQIHRSLGPFCPIDTTFYVTAVDAPETDLEFLFYLLRHIDLTRITGDVGVPGLNREMAYLEPVRFPAAIPEQKKIAHILSTVQRAIEVQERIIQTTTELKKALMHKLFTEGLRGEPQKQTEIGLVPESWEVVEIGDLGKCVTGTTPKTKVASYYDPPSEDFIAPADLGARRYVYKSEKKISPYGMATIRPLPKNAVMCVCIGSSIGKVSMSYREHSATNQQINSIICKIGRDPEFVYYLLSYRWEYWKSFATFGPVPILSKGRFTSIAVAIPSSVEEQQAIAEPLIALETKIEVAEKKVAALNDLFRTLLHELMTAKIRVHKLEITGLNS
jgi:type I restriction enzyme S subunit